jgi:hypothetical protein
MQSQFSIPSRIRRRPPINLCAHPTLVTSEWSSCSKAPLDRYRQGGVVYSGPSSTHLIQYCGHTPPPPTVPFALCAISKTLPSITWLTVMSGESLFGICAMRKSFHTRYESYAGTRAEKVSEGEPQGWRLNVRNTRPATTAYGPASLLPRPRIPNMSRREPHAVTSFARDMSALATLGSRKYSRGESD